MLRCLLLLDVMIQKNLTESHLQKNYEFIPREFYHQLMQLLLSSFYLLLFLPLIVLQPPFVLIIPEAFAL